ncbi:MAG: glycosyltransferase family protein, partial [Armatimonadota bacterium]
LFLPYSFLVARDGDEMAQMMDDVTRDEEMRVELVRNGLKSIAQRHTCAHRVDELWDICSELGMSIHDPQYSAHLESASGG